MTGNSIIYGDRTFTNLDVKEGRTTSERSPIGDVLTIDTLEFDVVSEDTTLTDFIRNTPLTFFHDDEQMGIFYVQKISRTSINTYHFACTSTVGLLDETYHDGGIYTGETVREVCTDICSPLTCYVKSNIANIKLYGWLPIATRRENLAQVLFAIGATLKVDYNGAIRIEGLWDGQSSEITASEMYAGGSVEYATPVTEVIVTEHAYSQSAMETTELFKGTTSAGDKITFDEPCYDLAASGFSILASGANWATVSAGSGVLTGKKYTHVTRQVMQQIKPKTRELVTQSDNTVKVENATLVSLANAAAIAERLAEYYSHNERINNKIAIKREIPGDVVKIAHPYGDTVTGCIESSDVTVSGKLASDESVLVGYKPQNIAEQEYYDTVEVLTKDGTWTVPENVTSIRAVLIGGGQGGTKGKNGEDGNNQSGGEHCTPIRSSSGSISWFSAAYGGNGGEAGRKGERGNIFTTELKVVPGMQIACAIGSGGLGASQDSASGMLGGNTIFGDFSSANGSQPTINGYMDPILGLKCCVDGADGVSGGNGSGGKKAQVSSPLDIDEFNIIDQDGVVWYCGEADRNITRNQNAWCYGGTGGGAAVGQNGGNGLASLKGDNIRYYTTGDGGAGANAAPPKIQTSYGSGGNGGNGGGGGGGTGATNMTMTWNHGEAISLLGKGGDGGIGSNGGDGASGCVLVYYRLPKTLVSGAVRDKNGKIISDKYGRRLVV